jgi:hypothetical protein
MKRKLEQKDICGYFPYGLNVIWKKDMKVKDRRLYGMVCLMMLHGISAV